MNRKGFEQLTVVLLFLMVLIAFSFAQKESRKLDRLYKTAHSIQQKAPLQRVNTPTASAIKVTN